MTAALILAVIDAEYALYEPLLRARQETARAALGRYRQQLPLCSVTPADGARAVPDQSDHHPGYEDSGWPEELLPPTVPCNLWIDQYQTDAGECGFAVTLAHGLGGVEWRRQLVYGPEAGGWESESWHAMEDGA